MTIYKDKRNGHYCYKFVYKGIQYHKCFKDACYDDVADYELIAKSELRKTGYDITKHRFDVTLSEIIEDYKIYAQNTYTRPEEAIKIVTTFYKLTGNKVAEQVNLTDLERYRASRKGVVSNSSINREMDNIKRVFSLAKTNKKMRFNPTDDLKDLSITHPTKRYLSKVEEKKLRKAANPMMKAIIITAIHTGMRCNELKNLKWSDVFLDEGYLWALNTKNNRPRKLIITRQIKWLLKNMEHKSEYVFTSPQTGEQYKDLKHTFARTVKRAGIPHITLHELRHTTASRMNELGIDTATIQEYLDHADIKTTRGYIHKPKKNIEDAVFKLSKYSL